MKILMDQRDVTPWVESLRIEQPADAIFRRFSLRLRGWHNVNLQVTWDIFGEPPAGTENSQLWIRRGQIPPDRPPQIDVNGAAIDINGYDGAYFAVRRTPRQTLVLCDDPREADQLISQATEPIGRVRILPRLRTVSDAVTALGLLAGFRVRWSGLDPDLGAFISSPTDSYWSMISTLINPLRPLTIYWPETGTLYVLDRVDGTQAFFPPIRLEADAISGVRLDTSVFRKVSRVVTRFRP